MKFEFSRYPKYEQAYLRAFEKMLKAREGNGKPYQKWRTADDVMRWWLSEEKQQKVDEDQKVYICFDNDEPGQQAAQRISKSLTEQNISNEILVPKAKDWNEDLVRLRKEQPG